ncbi:OLC1v1031771C1 [Oldenlandia corymbosa var. corymbosa]|uniref:OLC1v1031771C1 n=1 Tax=Oldenlandia corymbosa var. corymbosa TaxID=529605 RepID=A0AAV1CK54_OLDCO|nr:OLC1v1031771C1 [Oldenlandia corymbosa var. corymbosa]
MAEGFVKKDGMKRLSDVAEEYLNDLIGRSLLMVAEQKCNGGAKTCCIHDLLHEFCLHKAQDDQFFYFLKGGYDELLLRVLDLEQIDLGVTIPNEIELLVRLAYFAIRKKFGGIPPSIANLSNLETFIVNGHFGKNISLPGNFWNLQKLKHFCMTGSRFNGGMLPLENLDNSPDLYDLERICRVILPLDCNIMEGLMRKFPNIRIR